MYSIGETREFSVGNEVTPDSYDNNVMNELSRFLKSELYYPKRTILTTAKDERSRRKMKRKKITSRLAFEMTFSTKSSFAENPK